MSGGVPAYTNSALSCSVTPTQGEGRGDAEIDLQAAPRVVLDLVGQGGQELCDIGRFHHQWGNPCERLQLLAEKSQAPNGLPELLGLLLDLRWSTQGLAEELRVPFDARGETGEFVADIC